MEGREESHERKQTWEDFLNLKLENTVYSKRSERLCHILAVEASVHYSNSVLDQLVKGGWLFPANEQASLSIAY